MGNSGRVEQAAADLEHDGPAHATPAGFTLLLPRLS